MGGAKVCFTREDELVGTAGGVKRVSDHFDEMLVVVMGDALTDVREMSRFTRRRMERSGTRGVKYENS